MHVVVAEQGAVLPGTTAVCGDSHTCTNGALGAIAFGIGSTEIAHAPAYQALWLPRPKTLRVTVDGALDPHVSAKDIALAIISRFSTDGGAGCAMEYAGSVIRALSVEGRMTLCNLSIEFGSRIGLIAPDDAVFSYLHGRPRAPKGAAFDAAVGAWRALASDDNATFDKEYALDASSIAPTVSWGTSPEDAIPVDGAIPRLADARNQVQRSRWERALSYVSLPQIGAGSAQTLAWAAYRQQMWALLDSGFRVVIARSFAEIFEQNALWLQSAVYFLVLQTEICTTAIWPTRTMSP